MHTEIGDFHYFDDDNINTTGGTATGNAVENAAGATAVMPPSSSNIAQNTYTPSPTYGAFQANNYPSKVKNLTQEQVDNLYCQGFYKPNHIETFNDNHLAEQIFDIGVNIGSTKGIPIIQNAYNDISNNNIAVDGTIGTGTVSAINSLSDDELLRLNNKMVDRRLQYYDGLKDRDKYPGWYTRAKSFRR